MSITIRRASKEFQVLAGAKTLPEGQSVELFTPSELTALHTERLQEPNEDLLLHT